jgi:hypothetical protein
MTGPDSRRFRPDRKLTSLGTVGLGLATAREGGVPYRQVGVCPQGLPGQISAFLGEDGAIWRNRPYRPHTDVIAVNVTSQQTSGPPLRPSAATLSRPDQRADDHRIRP